LHSGICIIIHNLKVLIWIRTAHLLVSSSVCCNSRLLGEGETGGGGAVSLSIKFNFHGNFLSRPGIPGYIFNIVTFNLAIIIHILEEVVLEPI
jgi:hypothetical protein